MINVVAKFTVKPESIEDFKANVRELLVATKKYDAGCIKYDLYTVAEKPEEFVFVEEWADQAALDGHFKAKAFQEIMPKLRGFTSKDLEIMRLELFE